MNERANKLALLIKRMKWYRAGCDGLEDLAEYQTSPMGLMSDAAGDLEDAIEIIHQLVLERDALREPLRAFTRAAYPVADSINKRGHNWSEGYLDSALITANAVLADPRYQ